MTSSADELASCPIGIFDSGHGGLTVLHEIARMLPNEDTVYVSDSANFPYGPRDLEEVRGFATSICEYLCSIGCKLVVVACNTATAAALPHLQERFDTPVIGVVEPGARAAVQASSNRRIGIMATVGTVGSGVYDKAVLHQDAGAKVFSVACGRLVEIAEAGLYARATEQENREYLEVVRQYIGPLLDQDVDTIVMGCTHFPLIRDLIKESANAGTTLVSSAEETSREVSEILSRKGALAPKGRIATRKFLTTGTDVELLSRFARAVVGDELDEVVDDPDAAIGRREDAHGAHGARYEFEKVIIR